jgi:hypothetical protein
MLDPQFKRYLDELGREQDRMMAQHDQWTRDREAKGEAQARESDEDDLDEHRAREESAQAPAAEPSGLGFFGDERDDMLARAIGYVISELRHERRAAIAALQKQWQEDLDSRDGKLMHALARFGFAGERAEQEAYELIGRVTRLEQQIRELSEARRKDLAREAEIIELPDWRSRGVA